MLAHRLCWSSWTLLLGQMLACLLLPTSATADDGFYQKNKFINFILMTKPGGIYDVYSRLVVTHLGKHIPGHPALVIKYMPGASGMTAANHLYSLAPQDGTTMGMLINDLAVTQALEPESVKVDARNYNWIGRLNVLTQSVMIASSAGVGSMEEAKRKETVFGIFGKDSNDYKIAILLKTLAGVKMRLVLGYKGSAELMLAMDQGEIQGRIGSWLSISSERSERLKDGALKVLAQSGQSRLPELPNVPLLVELVDKPEDKRMMELIDAGTEVGWSVLMPPGVPAERVATVRAAFQEMLADPEFLADAQKSGAPLSPLPGEELKNVVARTLNTPPDLVKLTRSMIGQ